MNELVSVIVPVYQSKYYLEDCIQSILNQTYNEIEIILVDDGSTDGTEVICDEYANKFENVTVYHQKNAGVSVARNTGIEISHGQYIIFVDSDDYIDRNIIQQAIESYLTLDIDLCFFDFQMVSESKLKKYERTILFEKNTIFTHTEFLHCILQIYLTSVLHAIGTKLYKKSIIQQNHLQFQTGWDYYEDIYFCLSYLRYCENIIFLNTIGYFYRIGNVNSLSHASVTNRGEALFETFYLLKNMLKESWDDEVQTQFYDIYNKCIGNFITKKEESKLTDKYKNMFLFMDKWMNNHLKGIDICDNLISKGYHDVAIYGMNYFGQTLLNELDKSKINVRYGVDRNADKITSSIMMYKPDEKLPDVDAFIVTAVSSFREIKKLLSLKIDSKVVVISLEELIYENL